MSELQTLRSHLRRHLPSIRGSRKYDYHEVFQPMRIVHLKSDTDRIGIGGYLT